MKFLFAKLPYAPAGARSRVSNGRADRHRFGRLALTLVALGMAAALFPGHSSAQNSSSEIYDPINKTWIPYSTRQAYRYFEANGQTPEEFERRIVDFRTAEEPGTIIIDSDRHFLYLVQPGFKAIRYGIGVGREGFGWAGRVNVGRKVEWPTWTPPAEMVERDPKAAKYKDGMPGGPDNPLGARAIYLFEGDRDTIYRIHGTTEPWSIGLNISSGCIRLNNDDVIDLYQRVEVGAKVIVLMQGAALYKGV